MEKGKGPYEALVPYNGPYIWAVQSWGGPKIGPKIGANKTVIFLMIFSNLLLKRVGNTLIG